MEDWLAESFHILSDAINAFSLFPGEPISSARLYWVTRSSEIMFRAPHWLIDSLGIVMFWAVFFTLIEAGEDEKDGSKNETARHAWGDEVERLGPMMRRSGNTTSS